MRVLSLSLLTLCLAAGAAQAAPQQPHPHPLTVSSETSQIPFENVEGAYRLSDGRVLRLSQSNGHLYGTVNNRHTHEFVPAGPNKVATKDGKIIITFQPGDPVENLKYSE